MFLSFTGHHVCLFFTQYTPYTLSNGRTWDEKTKEDYAKLIFDTVEAYAPGNTETVTSYSSVIPQNIPSS